MDLIELPVDTSIVDNLYISNKLKYQIEKVPNNQYLILYSDINPKHTVLARYCDGWIYKANHDFKKYVISPKDARQTVLLDSLNQESILVSVALGAAGTGKTTMAMSYALQEFHTKGKPIKLAKLTTMVGKAKAFGPIPGDIKEKYQPYTSAFEIVFNKLLGDRSGEYKSMMELKGAIEYVPVELSRGCTYENCTFILDEAQNLVWHELNTLITRIGKDSKLIILGDLNQIDIPISREETGLYKLINSKIFRDSQLSTAIELKAQYRSPLTQLIIEIDQELNNAKEKRSSRDS
jgi:predicted ribonuclease YlaK